MSFLATRQFWSGLLFTSVGVAFLVLAQDNSMGSAADMGPAYFPSLVAILLIGLGLITCIRGASVASDPIEFATLRPLVVIVLATIAFGLLLERLGLMLATGALVGISVFAGGTPRLTETVLLAAVLMAIGAVVFVWGLGVMVPLLPTVGWPER